jgi:hypothetical protein
VISARDILFDEEEFYDGRPIQFTDSLISQLDEVVEKVNVVPDSSLEDIQLREDDSDTEGIENEEEIQDINDVEDTDVGVPIDRVSIDGASIDGVSMDDGVLRDNGVSMEEGVTINTDWKPNPYPTPDPSVESTFLTSLDHVFPVSFEGVKSVSHLAVLPNKLDTALPEIPDVEPTILHDIRQKNDECFYNFHQQRVPQNGNPPSKPEPPTKGTSHQPPRATRH